MAINIFDKRGKAGASVDIVGRFRSGHLIGKRPQALEEWRVTTDDPEVAAKVAELFGGEPQEWDNEKQPYEVFTDAKSVPVIVERIFSSMALYGRSGLIRRCDGMTLSYPEEQAGEPCECAKYGSIADRKAAAQRGIGCQPDILVRFRLANAPDLGLFEFRSSSWSLAQDIGNVEDSLSDYDGAAVGTITLTPVEFTQKDTGLERRFTKTVIELTGPAPKGDDE